ncbi:argininosuccinate synthase [Microscilla marina]|uniref:argininosuccinate synthase n=1 Tax=Microscilla marina ATCC 23134 TaxID=313606 RepID=A1ZN86_MICM2|nr:argininosuccinate synthase domain-containing protein [Microscilla marina]EAY28267.1 argininosuccinate synthase [Microscilla marina ATCC 23134]
MTDTSNNKVVLAFSGGLDTSYCAQYLAQEKGMEVYAVAVNTGGFSDEELKQIAQRAEQLNVVDFKVLDCTNQYYEECVKYLIFGNILRNQTYPLSVSAERMFQALAVANYTQELGAKYVAHGSTGAGNDQVRFDLAFQIIMPEVEIITPIRDLQLSREAEIDYLKANGIHDDWEKAAYSINQGLWGTSVGGKETLTSHQPLPEEAYPSQLQQTEPLQVTLVFAQGELKGLQWGNEAAQTYHNPVDAINQLNKLAAPYAIGRDVHVGDTIIGIKGRVGFEAAAPLIIIKGHHTLEKHTLTKWQQYWKEQLGNWYGMLLHEGQYLDPVMRNIEHFLADTQTTVSGQVFVQLHPYRFEIAGIASDHDLMQAKFGHYGEMNREWSGDDVKGFTKILGNAHKIYHSVNKV